MKTVLCHFYNEEFLLPWWLKHHRKIFDHGIMLDYHSTDRSAAIIKELCPTWEVVTSRNDSFGADAVDKEVVDHEARLPENTLRICLNTTEFLYGDFTSLNQSQYIVPSIMMISKTMGEYFSHETPLTELVKTGVHWEQHNERVGRSMHTNPIIYPCTGRHYWVGPEVFTKQFMLFHYGWAPMCEDLLKRKLQIQTQIPETDIQQRLGYHHIIEHDALVQKWQAEYVPIARDVSPEIRFWFDTTFR